MANRNRKADSARPPQPPAPATPQQPLRLAHPPRPPQNPGDLHAPHDAAAPDLAALITQPPPARPPRRFRPISICARRFGQNVRAARLRMGLSQEDLELKCKVHRSHVSLIETGRRMARLDTICTLAQALDVQPGELMPKMTRDEGGLTCATGCRVPARQPVWLTGDV